MASVGVSDTGNSNQRHVNINANIARIEAEIATTKARLEQRLEDQKSLISPVRKAPVELLSAVFEFCNGEVWESPLRIAGVCTHWRRTVLSSPLAWSHIELHRKPPTEILELYLERSRPSHLHLTLPPFDRFDSYCGNLSELSKSFSDRITCLHASAAWLQVMSLPNLRRVQVRGSVSSVNFPFRGNLSLRYLEASFGPLHSPNLISTARVQHLHLWAEGWGNCWANAIRGLGSTLVSLKIMLHPYDSPAFTDTFDLPHLRYLQIYSNYQVVSRWEFKASTPHLQSHVPLAIMEPNGTVYYQEVDVSNVTHLVIGGSGSLGLAAYHKLHYLRLPFRPIEIMEQLRADDRLCPSLVLIEYKDATEHWKQRQSLSDGEVPTAEVTMTIDRSQSGTPGQISVIRTPLWSPWSLKLPNEIEETCDAHVGVAIWEVESP